MAGGGDEAIPRSSVISGIATTLRNAKRPSGSRNDIKIARKGGFLVVSIKYLVLSMETVNMSSLRKQGSRKVKIIYHHWILRVSQREAFGPRE